MSPLLGTTVNDIVGGGGTLFTVRTIRNTLMQTVGITQNVSVLNQEVYIGL
jgi:hypothetical protein